jgi:AraC-like DNA-binding protein
MELFFVIAGFLLVSIAAAFIYMLYDKRNKAYKALVQKQMDIVACEAGETGIKPETGKKYKTSSLSTERKIEIAAALENAMKKDKVFLQPDLSLGKLAQYLGVNSKYLSQVIHETTGEHVTDFINRYRINEASRLLLDPAYHHISVEGIAEMVGFGSKSTFNAAFKKFTGVTPSFFVHTAKNLSKKDTGKI